MQCHNRHPLGHASLTHSNMLPSPDDLNISLRLKTITRPFPARKHIICANAPVPNGNFVCAKSRKESACLPWSSTKQRRCSPFSTLIDKITPNFRLHCKGGISCQKKNRND